MSRSPHFTQALRQLTLQHPPAPEPQRWIYLPYDQLHAQLGPLARHPPDQLGVLLVENPRKARRRPYHKQKIAFLLSSMRHFALELAAQGRPLRYIAHDGPYHEALTRFAQHLTQPLLVMSPAEHELRADLANLDPNLIELIPHEGWLTSPELFLKSQGKRKSWRMDAFYKAARAAHDILMEPDGSPTGGKLSFDDENRQPWRGEPRPPEPLRFEPDAITLEVGALIETAFKDHPGRLDLTTIPASRADAEAALDWAMTRCLPLFGPYEDAISATERTLFHTLLSPLINLHRLTPREVLDAALAEDVPLQSKEGFVRQLLGWREFMRHVHAQTDGLRSLPHGHQGPVTRSQPLFETFWGEPKSGLHCLDHAVEGVMETGWSHHIERLMILCNLGTLLDVDPQALSDWFWVSYIDAFDWVVEPNVLGMGTFALGDLFTTKPYVSGANYINKMSDLCRKCQFSPASTCPVTPLYWAFLARHEDTLSSNPRMGLVFKGLGRRTDAQRALDEAIFTHVTSALASGDTLDVAGLAALGDSDEGQLILPV